MENVSQLDDSALLLKLEMLNATEHDAMLGVLICLHEVETRSLHVKEGYASLFAYCTQKLKYSEPAASRRIASARCIGAFPEVFTLLERKEVSLTTISLFYGILTEQNLTEVLASVRGKSRTDVERIVASFSPKKKLQTQSIKPVFVETPSLPLAPCAPVAKGIAAPQEFTLMEQYKVSFSVSKEFLRN